MKKMTFLILVCSMTLGLGGCATGPTQEQLANANYGSPIAEADAKAKAEIWIRGVLKDPESARFEWESFHKGWIDQGLLYGGGYLYGYQLRVRVNAKNSFGGYTGPRLYLLMFRDGEIAAAWNEQDYTNGGLTTRRMARLK